MGKGLSICIIFSLLFMMSYVNACSYPAQINCDSEEEVNVITQEWAEDKCTRDELGQCIDAWTNYWEEKGCNPVWNCGSWSDCTNNKQTRNCDDGCGNTKSENKNCCTPKVDCYLGVCKDNKIPMYCVDSCGSVKVDHYEVCTTPEDSYKQNIAEQRENIEDLTNPTHETLSISGNPLIFVHGWTGSGKSFEELKQKIEWDTSIVHQSGTEKVETYDVSYANIGCVELAEYGIREHAIQLQKEVDKVLSNSNYYKIDIIAHSMGGLTARYYIKYLGGDKKVRKLIMLGTPNHGASGTFGGLIQSFTKGCNQDKSLQDLNYDSQFLKNLNSNDETYGEVEYYTIYSSLDPVVLTGVQLIGAKNWEDTKCGATYVNGEYENGHANLRIPSNCYLAYKQILDSLIQNQYFEDKINPPVAQQTTSSVTGNIVTEESRTCIKKFLGFLWCIKWE